MQDPVPAPTALFVTGAGTDVGKTYVTALLARRLKASGRAVAALKPVASGVPPMDDPAIAATDAGQLLAALWEAITPASVAACSPWRFAAPLSPDMAAAAEGRTVGLAEVLDWCRGKIEAAEGASVLIEGVGGVMSPMTSDALNLDLIKALNVPVLLVTGTYLGALTHALTALETLEAHTVAVTAVVLNESEGSSVDFDATLAALQRYAPGRTIVPLRRGARSLAIDPA
jgi:dethiobiotin synthetase